MATRAVLFDLGNTLAGYYDLADFPSILERCLASCADSLLSAGQQPPGVLVIKDRAEAENHESRDGRVRPLDERLRRIFGLEHWDAAQIDAICRSFIQPIFALGLVYSDSEPCLMALREQGFKTAIVTNSPWGSAPHLWREELERLGLARLVDAVVCCGDVGWRKPAGPIFQRVVEMLGMRFDECVFIGDDPRWDIAGPAAVGMPAILIDRSGRRPDGAGSVIGGLNELPSLISAGRNRSL